MIGRPPRGRLVDSCGPAVVLAGIVLSCCVPRTAGAQTILLSLSGAPSGGQSNDNSQMPATSEDGRHTAFSSAANNLVVGDPDGRKDVFVYDRVLGTTVMVSVDDDGNSANQDCERPSISRDGRYVAFDSSAPNLVPNDMNGIRDVFLHDRDHDGNGIFDEAGGIRTIRVSVDEEGLERSRASSFASISGDGLWVAFQGNKSSGQSDILVYSVSSGVTRKLSVDSEGIPGSGDSENPHLSGDGRYLVFDTSSTLTPEDTNGRIDVYLVDRDQDENSVFDEPGTFHTERISVAVGGGDANGVSQGPFVSDDGESIVFSSVASDLIDLDNNGKRDVFVRDRATGTTFLVSAAADGTQGNGESTAPVLSRDGRVVLFTTASSNLIPGDTNQRRDVMGYDRDIDADGNLDQPGKTLLYRVSVDTGGNEVNGDSGDSLRPGVSADGLFAAFDSSAPDLVSSDTNSKRDIFGRFLSECGDFIRTVDEECDDGNFIDGDGCDANCTVTACGNGVQTAGEECDDGNAVEGDGCDTNCTQTGCGNGIPTAGEECDDGNGVEGDGCDTNCTFTGCGNGISTLGEACDEGADNDVGGCCSGLCALIDFDSDGVCDVDDLADMSNADLNMVSVRDSGGDPDRPTGSLSWNGRLYIDGVAPYHSAAALLAQAESTGFRVEVHSSLDQPTTADAPVYAFDLAPSDCVFRGTVGARKRAKCKKTLPLPHLTVLKFGLSARSNAVSVKGGAKRAELYAPLSGPLHIVLGVNGPDALEFQASLGNCSRRGKSRFTMRCSP